MVRKATFSSRSFNSSLINSYGLEMFFCFLVCIFFFFSSIQKNNFFINVKYYVISFSEPGLRIISFPFEFINNSFYYLSNLTELEQLNKELKLENNILKDKLRLVMRMKLKILDLRNFLVLITKIMLEK